MSLIDKILGREKEKIDSMCLVAPFDKGKETLEKSGYRIITLPENVRLRIQEGKESFISRNGNLPVAR